MKVKIGDHIHYKKYFEAIIVSKEGDHYIAKITKNFLRWNIGDMVSTAWQSELESGNITIINKEPLKLTNYNFTAKNKRRMICRISKVSR